MSADAKPVDEVISATASDASVSVVTQRGAVVGIAFSLNDSEDDV